MAAEGAPPEARPPSEAERAVVDGMMTTTELRLLNEIVRRWLWEEEGSGF